MREVKSIDEYQLSAPTEAPNPVKGCKFTKKRFLPDYLFPNQTVEPGSPAAAKKWYQCIVYMTKSKSAVNQVRCRAVKATCNTENDAHTQKHNTTRVASFQANLFNNPLQNNAFGPHLRQCLGCPPIKCLLDQALAFRSCDVAGGVLPKCVEFQRSHHGLIRQRKPQNTELKKAHHTPVGPVLLSPSQYQDKTNM